MTEYRYRQNSDGVRPLFSKPKRRQTPGTIMHGH